MRVAAKEERVRGIAPGQRQWDRGGALLRLVSRATVRIDTHRRRQRLQHRRLSLAVFAGQNGNRRGEGHGEGQGELYDVRRELGIIVNTGMAEVDHGCGSWSICLSSSKPSAPSMNGTSLFSSFSIGTAVP